MIVYNVPTNIQRMTIGVQGENNVREFRFDVTEWRQLTGNIGTAQMVVQRAGDASPYAAVITMYDEDTVSWIPTSIDTAKAGAGKLQLMWIVSGQTIKAKIFNMKVDKSLDYAVPDSSLDPWASWMPNLLNADSRITTLENEIPALRAAVGTPLTASTVADMTDTTKIYVYTGEDTTGIDNGDWCYWDGDAWVSGGVYNSVALETDTTLLVSGAAADAEVTGEKIAALSEMIDDSILNEMVDVSIGAWNIGRYIDSDGSISQSDYAAVSATFGRLKSPQIAPAYLYTGALQDANNVSLYCHIIEYGENMTFIKRTLLTSGNSLVFVGSDTKFVRFQLGRNAATGVTISWDDITNYFAVQSVEPRNAIPDLEKIVTGRIVQSAGNYTDGKMIRYDNGELGNAGWSASYYVYLPDETKAVEYVRLRITSTGSKAGMAFYDENLDYISGVPSIMGADAFGKEWNIVDKPPTAKYARFTYYPSTNPLYDTTNDGKVFLIYNENNLVDSVLSGRNGSIGFGQDASRMGLHVEPKSIGQLNVVKRCRQMTDIKWTPVVDLPRYMLVSGSPPYDDDYNSEMLDNYLGVFKAGVEYTGIPYGRCTDYLSATGYSDTYVGCTIDFETFITAVRNPLSVISVGSSGSISGHRSVPYAAVCSALTCYALDVTYVPTANIPNISGLYKVTDLIVDGAYIDPNLIELGDCLNLQSYHTGMITDIVKDANGDTIYIEVSEATTTGNGNQDVEGGQTGGICRRKAFDITEFFYRFGNYALLRYANIDSVPYTPSKYVNVGGELDFYRLDELPCMPYYGEGFVYISGHISNSNIVITNHQYSYLRVFRDGSELTASPFSVDENTTAIDVGFSATGNYEAYLCNMSDGDNTSVSAKCHWRVV